jgi:hypothetical protein
LTIPLNSHYDFNGAPLVNRDYLSTEASINVRLAALKKSRVNYDNYMVPTLDFATWAFMTQQQREEQARLVYMFYYFDSDLKKISYTIYRFSYLILYFFSCFLIVRTQKREKELVQIEIERTRRYLNIHRIVQGLPAVDGGPTPNRIDFDRDTGRDSIAPLKFESSLMKSSPSVLSSNNLNGSISSSLPSSSIYSSLNTRLQTQPQSSVSNLSTYPQISSISSSSSSSISTLQLPSTTYSHTAFMSPIAHKNVNDQFFTPISTPLSTFSHSSIERKTPPPYTPNMLSNRREDGEIPQAEPSASILSTTQQHDFAHWIKDLLSSNQEMRAKLAETRTDLDRSLANVTTS